jgi:PAS domain S-box-containing protein
VTLSQRTILIVVSTFIALLFILGATSDLILLSSFSALEKQDITSHAKHISNHINDKLEQLDFSTLTIAEQLRTADGSGWRAQHADEQMFTRHFMVSNDIDFAAVFDSSGLPVSLTAFDCDKREFKIVTSEQRESLHKVVAQMISTGKQSGKGALNLGGKPLLVSVRSVGANDGVPNGVVIAGWYIDAVEMERVFRASGAAITVHDLQKTLEPDVAKAAAGVTDNVFYSDTINQNSVAGYFTVKDLNGTPGFMVRAIENRLLHKHGKVTIAYIFTALLTACAIICLVMLIFVRGTILNRLQTLTAKVRQITQKRDISSRLPLSIHEDELHTLAASINGMLESLENAEAAIRESEERYRMLFDRAPDAIIIIGVEGDEAGRIVSANRAAAEQHGYTLDELCNLSIADLNTSEANSEAGTITSKILAGEWLITELWHQKKDGTCFPIEVHAGLIRIGGKKYILGFDRDITQRKISEEADHLYLEQISQLNSELNRKALDLAAANNELEAFNYSVSHDMRGPLTRISGYCQLMLEDTTDLSQIYRDYVAKIYESETWLNDMIDSLLELAQLTRTEIDVKSVNLSDMAGTILAELALENPVRIFDIQVAPGVIARGDSRLLKVVMTNLLGNAWKYSSGREMARIEFGTECNDAETVYFVQDNGAGFNMKDVNKLFRVFTRLHDASQFDGTGIGLATVQRIVFRHGGRIWAHAAPDRGATFYFTLP